MEASVFFFGVADFFGVVDFLAAAFFAGAAGFAGPFVTRPDLVFPSTFSTSTTAGAWREISCCIAAFLTEDLQMPVSCA